MRKEKKRRKCFQKHKIQQDAKAKAKAGPRGNRIPYMYRYEVVNKYTAQPTQHQSTTIKPAGIPENENQSKYVIYFR